MTTKRQKNWKYRHKGTTKRHKTTTETQKYCKETQKNHNGRHRDHKTTTGTQMYHKETQNEYRDTKQLQRHQSAINHKKETKKLAQRHTWQLQSVLKTTTQRHVTTTKRQEMALKRRCGVLGVNEGLGDLLHVCAQGPVVSWSRPRLWGVMRCGGAERGWGGGGRLSHKSLFVSRSVYSRPSSAARDQSGRSSVGVPLSRWRQALMQRFSMRLLLSWRWCEIWARSGGAHEGDAWQQPVGAAHSKNVLLWLEFGALLSTAQINREQRLGQICSWARWWICIFQTYSSYL